MTHIPFDEDRQRRFCEAFRESGNIRLACAKAGVSRSQVSRLLKNDADFKAAYDDALDDAVDGLEAKAMERAFNGVKEPVFHKGEECGTITRYSDSLTMFLLKALSPKYRDKATVDVNVNDDLAKRIAAARAQSGQGHADPG